jgi:segregation and condensation protein B
VEHKIKDIIMGCLFISGDEGVSPVELRRIVNMDADGVREVLKEIKKELKSEKKYMQLVEWGGRFKLTTLPEHHKYYEILAVEKLRTPLRPNLMETLAVIAYNQPCTRRMVDDIRGTNNNINIDRLIDKGLVEEIGRDSSPGNPFLYEVTKKFYDLFGIKTLSDLPKPNDFAIEATDEEVFEFTKKLKEEEIQNEILEDQKEKEEMEEILKKNIEDEIEQEESDNNEEGNDTNDSESNTNNNIDSEDPDEDEDEDNEEEYDDDEDEEEEEEEEYVDSHEDSKDFSAELDISPTHITSTEINSEKVSITNNNISITKEHEEEISFEYKNDSVEEIEPESKLTHEKIEIEEIQKYNNSQTIRKTDTRILEELLDDEDDEDDDIFSDVEDED